MFVPLATACIALLGVVTAEFYECGVSTAEEAVIVDAHNNYRLQIAKGQVDGQPRGINLKRMAWDDTLAAEAQKVADLGKFEHLVVPDDRFPHGHVGQNLYISMSSGKSAGTDWVGGVKAWWDEHYDFTYGASSQSGVTGHYTQVVWADTNLVGCGFCHYYDDTSSSFPYKKLYVCNYGPAGNYAGEDPYETGSSGCEDLC